MTSHYKKAMEQVSLSPEAADSIRKSIPKNTQKNSMGSKDASVKTSVKNAMFKKPAARRLAGMAAALCLALGLISTGAASAYGYFFHKIPEEVAGSLRPIKLTHTSQDITMTVQYASVEDGTLAAYVTLEDISGEDRLAQGVDFYHSYRVNRPAGTDEMFYKYRSLGYDEESRTYGFLVEITPTSQNGDALYFQNQRYTLSVGQLLLAQKHSEPLLQPEWDTLPANPESSLRSCFSWGYVDNYTRNVRAKDSMAQVLAPGSWELPLTDGFTITAAGFLDNGFHVQVRFDDKNAPRSHGQLTLITSDGTVIGNVLASPCSDRACHVGFEDEAQYRYTEFIYNISPEELAGASLGGTFASGGWLLDGDWEVTFSLVENEESGENPAP